MPSPISITGIPGLMIHFARLVSFVVSGFLPMASIWRRAAIKRPRSMIQRLAPKHGSVPLTHVAEGTPDADCRY